MSRYIVTEEQAQFIAKHMGIFTGQELVECKECRWQITAYCPMPSWERKDKHYCYKGERRKDETD